MKQNDTNTESAILKAAEEIFIKKGYSASKTTEIAQRAGVTHAMLHYYFRTKENLFNKVFEEKVKLLGEAFVNVFKQNVPFFQKLKLAIETHFDFLTTHPTLPMFVLSEILRNEERRETIKKLLLPQLHEMVKGVQEAINMEVENHKIRYIEAADLILNIVSLNVFSFVAIELISPEQIPHLYESKESFLKTRKESIIQTVLNSIKI